MPLPFELRKWAIGERELRGFCNNTHIRIITPGSDAGESRFRVG